jgi:hypothetical protein
VLRLIERPGHQALLRVPPATRALVSWNGNAPAGGIALAVHRSDGSVAEPLLYARWSPVELDAIAVSVPPPEDARVAVRRRVAALDVPAFSQTVGGHPESTRAWCSPASLTMLLRYHGVNVDVATVARAVFDASYDGTGNWAFNVAYAGVCGLRGVVAYLRGLDHVAAFVEAGLPVAISIAWNARELPGAPREHSDGHLLVVRGFEPAAVLVNDPAQPAVVTRYDRAALDRAFRGHGSVAYLIAPRERSEELLALANATEPAVRR